MKKLLFIFALPMLVLIGCSPENEFHAPPAPEVGVQNPVVKDVTVYDSFPGRVSASEDVEIRARVTGFLESINFEEGTLVNKGDLLFTIEAAQYQSAVNAAKAKVAQAEAALALAENTWKKNIKAAKSKAVSELDVETAAADKDSAAAALLAAKAELEKAELDLSYTQIHAPFTGRIGRRQLSVGNLVGSGESTLLTTLIVENPIDVFFNLDERTIKAYLDKFGRSQEKERKAPSVKLELVDGEIHGEDGVPDYIDPEIDPDTGTARVRAVFPNKESKLVSGMYGKILVPDEVKGAVLVPDLCLQRDLSGAFVLVVGEGDKVESRYVERGALVGTERIITDGLSAEDRVIVKGLQRARPGIPVRIAADEPAENVKAAPAAE